MSYMQGRHVETQLPCSDQSVTHTLLAKTYLLQLWHSDTLKRVLSTKSVLKVAKYQNKVHMVTFVWDLDFYNMIKLN